MRDTAVNSNNKIYGAKRSARSKYQEECEKQFFLRRAQNYMRRSIKLVTLVGIALLIAALIYIINPSTRNSLVSSISDSFYQITADLGLKIKEIKLKGVEIADKAELVMALNVAEDDPILGVDLEQLKNDFKNLSWVEEVNVRRMLPQNIEIKIKERKPVAVWQNKGNLFLIDKAGIVITQLEPNNSFNFPLIVGDNSNVTASATLAKFSQQDKLTKRIKILTRYGDRRWDITLDNGIIIKLPAEDEEIAWQRLEDLESTQNILSRYIEEIDLRYNDKVFIKLPNSEIIETYNNG